MTSTKKTGSMSRNGAFQAAQTGAIMGRPVCLSRLEWPPLHIFSSRLEERRPGPPTHMDFVILGATDSGNPLRSKAAIWVQPGHRACSASGHHPGSRNRVRRVAPRASAAAGVTARFLSPRRPCSVALLLTFGNGSAGRALRCGPRGRTGSNLRVRASTRARSSGLAAAAQADSDRRRAARGRARPQRRQSVTARAGPLGHHDGPGDGPPEKSIQCNYYGALWAFRPTGRMPGVASCKRAT